MKDIDKKLLAILKKFLNGDIDFWELDGLWIDNYIEETEDFYYDNLFSEITELIYMGQKDLKLKIGDEIKKYPELKEYP
jgi:hypothetical protein